MKNIYSWCATVTYSHSGFITSTQIYFKTLFTIITWLVQFINFNVCNINVKKKTLTWHCYLCHLFETMYKMNISLLYFSCYLTSMFLLATFFTTAGNSSDEFFPMAMSWAQNKQQNSSIHWPSHYFHLLLQLREKLKESHFPWCTHPDDPFHGLQFERLLVALQHLLKVLIPVGRP